MNMTATTCPNECATNPPRSTNVTSPGYNAWPLIAVALGFVMAMLDVTVVNVASTHIQNGLAIGLSGLVWVIDGYTLSFAALLLACGALANRYGARAIYLCGLVVFIAASALCGLAPSGATLIAARLLQGVGAALFMPASLSLMTQSYPDANVRIKVLSTWSAIISIAAVLGPAVGGAVIAIIGWRGIFWLNVPIGIIGIALTFRHIAVSPRQAQALNPLGHVYAVIGLAGIAFAMIENSTFGWTSAPILGAMALGLTGIVAFVARECYSTTPIMPRDLFHDTRFAAANGIGFFINLAAFGQLFLISLYLQQVSGMDAWHTGMNLLPLMSTFTVGNLVSGRLSTRWGTRLPMLGGLIVAAALSSSIALWGHDLPYVVLAAAIVAINLGVGIAIPAMTVTVMQVAGQNHANIAAASLNANRQIGALIGVAIMGVVLHQIADWRTALPVAFGILAFGYLAAGLLVQRFIRTVDEQP
jgi:DHA2 family methylenomycin A resistance protein-like MFS transporter